MIEGSYVDISYGCYFVPVALGVLAIPGWILMGIGAYRSGDSAEVG
jgi:hypothetical protein